MLMTTTPTPEAPAPTVDETIGARLKAKRLARGFTLQHLGGAVGLTYQQVQKYETGRNRVASSTLLALAKALDIHPMDLLPWGDE